MGAGRRSTRCGCSPSRPPGHIGAPRRYLSSKGQFLEHSPYCERDLRGPAEPLQAEGEDVEVIVQHRGAGTTSAWTRFRYAHHPFDVVGWDGCLYPYVFSIHDFEPITGRLHQPPPVHQTFEGPNFVICSFVPRLFDYHPDGIPAPYNHANVDSDEMIFYTGGDFMSRKGAGIEQGSISLHPSGFTHGPQPGSVEASIGKEKTDELAVMVDTFRPLDLLEPAAGLRGHVVRLDLVGTHHRPGRRLHDGLTRGGTRGGADRGPPPDRAGPHDEHDHGTMSTITEHFSSQDLRGRWVGPCARPPAR